MGALAARSGEDGTIVVMVGERGELPSGLLHVGRWIEIWAEPGSCLEEDDRWPAAAIPSAHSSSEAWWG